MAESTDHRLLRRAQNSELPFSALPAIIELRRSLDDLERTCVQSARDKGASWEEIARALGITRQALRQRRHHASTATDPPRREATGVPEPAPS